MGGILIMGYYAKRFFKHVSDVLPGPVLFYRYENTTSTNSSIFDESGNGNTGVYFGVNPGGITDNYLWLRPFGNIYVKVSPSPTYFFGNGPFSFSSKVTVTAINTFQIIFSKQITGKNQFSFGFNSGKLYAQLFDATTGGYIRFLSKNIVLIANQTVVATGTYTGGADGIFKGYINGVEIEMIKSTSGLYQQMRDTGINLYIGNVEQLLNNSLTTFKGNIDNSMLWTRVISPEEILTLNTI